MALTDTAWVKPYWLERQTAFASSAFLPLAAGEEPANRTFRNWTVLGTLSSPFRATVDPRGLVTASGARWSLDWWIGAEDRWHVPSRDAVTRQRLVGDAPVVETAMRVPGGDAISRAYGFHSTELGACAVLEFENRTAVPFGVALALRPYDPVGLGRIESIDLDGTVVLVDGRPALLLPKEPGDVVVSTADGGDCYDDLDAGRATRGWPGRVVDPAGAATAAFVFPLTHTATLRVLLPLEAPPAPGRGGRAAGPRAALRYPDALAPAEVVAKGWDAQLRRGLQVTVPDDRLTHAFDSARAQLLLGVSGPALVTPGTYDDLATVVHVVGALDDVGFTEEAGRLLAGWPERQSLDGTFTSMPDRLDATAVALVAVGRHWKRTRDRTLVASLVGPLAKGVHRIEKLRTGRRGRRSPAVAGVLPAGYGPPYGGDTAAHRSYFRDAALAVQGLGLAADALEGIDQPEVAADARRFATSLRSQLIEAITASAGDRGGIAASAPDGGEAGVLTLLEVAEPFGVLPASDPVMAATLDHLRARYTREAAVVRGATPAGFDPVATLLLALVELEAGDERAWGRLQWLLDAASPTGVWPEVIHPATGGGAVGAPQDPTAPALLLTFVRRLLVREVAAPAVGRADEPGTVDLELCGYLPVTWLGQGIDVRDASTAAGRVSYAVRWHGERPALLWEVESHDDVRGVRLRAPGLDPTWSTTQLAGEALLAPIPPPPAVASSPAAGLPAPSAPSAPWPPPDGEGSFS